jgi:hypothetical protein
LEVSAISSENQRKSIEKYYNDFYLDKKFTKAMNPATVLYFLLGNESRIFSWIQYINFYVALYVVENFGLIMSR